MATLGVPSVTEGERLVMEMEFVQCLANPAYLAFLAQAGYFDDAKFVAYLGYLLYLRDPDYASYLTYPNGLIMLDLLQDVQFRRQLNDPACIAYIHRQQFYLWLNHRHRSDSALGKAGTGEGIDAGRGAEGGALPEAEK